MSITPDYGVLIVGARFSGIGTAIKLDRGDPAGVPGKPCDRLLRQVCVVLFHEPVAHASRSEVHADLGLTAADLVTSISSWIEWPTDAYGSQGK
jgi:hypothetical protein